MGITIIIVLGLLGMIFLGVSEPVWKAFARKISGSSGGLPDNELKALKEHLSNITEELKPIKDKILGCIDGNHEDRIERAVGDSPVHELSYRLNIEYFPHWCAYLFFSVGSFFNIEISAPEHHQKK